MTTKKAKIKKSLDPKKYASILKNVELREIFLESSTSEIFRDNIDPQKTMAVEIRERASFEQIKSRLKITHKYYLTAKNTDSKDVAIKITAGFRLNFESKGTIGKDFFDIFRDINLPYNSWPYFREFVQSMMQRMNIPPLTLPFLKR